MQDRSRHRPLGYAAARDCRIARDYARDAVAELNEALAVWDRNPDKARAIVDRARFALSEIAHLMRDVLETPTEPPP